MKRQVFFLVWIILLVSGICFGLNGSGTDTDPYLIESLADFDELAGDPNYWDDYVRLETNIDLKDTTYTDAVISHGSDFFGGDADGVKYTGNFNGNHKIITNLTIDSTGTGSFHVGLFGYAYPPANIYDLGIENCSINADGQFAGSLVGRNQGGDIERCYAYCNITNTRADTGGLIGESWGGRIEDCYAVGSVSGMSAVGGLLGRSNAEVISSYSTAAVSGTTDVGGLVGDGNWGRVVMGFWDMTASGMTVSQGGYGRATAEMKTASNYTSWTSGAWKIDEGIDYPRLIWEDSTGTVINNVVTQIYPGTGIETDPFIISSSNDLVCLSKRPDDWNGYVNISNNIDMAGVNDYMPIANFGGVLNGNGNSIKNLTFDLDYSTTNMALISYARLGSIIQDLGIEDANIDGGNLTAGLAGLNSGGIIERCFVSGQISGYDGVAGLVGKNNGGSIISCYNLADVDGHYWIGGITGVNFGNVSDCYNEGDMSGTSSVGGLVGQNSDPLSNSYNTGQVSELGNYGAVAGYNNGEISDCFWDSSVVAVSVGYAASSTGTATNVVGMITGQMQTEVNFTNSGWDFDDNDGDAAMWAMAAGDYPRLAWETAVPLTVDVPDVTGMTRADAESEIIAASLVVGTVTDAYDDSITAGNVISLSPVSGTNVEIGTAIDIVVSLGVEMVTVPDVVGMSQVDAVSDITGARLIVGEVHTIHSETVPAGNVISQIPSGNVLVTIGSAVNLTLSLGPAKSGETLFKENFETGAVDWTIDNGVWEIGVPTSGPGNAHEGNSVAGTILAGNYPYQTDSRLISPAIDLRVMSENDDILLRFWHWFDYDGGDNKDRGYVYISVWNDSAWGDWIYLATPVAAHEGDSYDRVYNTGWSRCGVDLTEYKGQKVRLSFYHVASRTNSSNGSRSGWYIDEVEVWQGVTDMPALESFESGWGHWYADNGVWQIGAPKSGPGSAHQGSSVVATDLSGSYPSQTDSRLISPSMDLPLLEENEDIQLRFWHWFDYDGGDSRDRGYVYISVWNDTAWGDWIYLATPVAAHEGDLYDRVYNTGWSRCGVDLTEYKGQKVRLSFYHVASLTGSLNGSRAGWYIDEVEVWQGIPDMPALESFESGWGDWYADNGVWQIGVPTYGVTSGHDGNSVAATDLSSSYPSQTDSRLISPSMYLPLLEENEDIQLRFWQWFDYDGGDSRDKGYVQISVWDGFSWGNWVSLATPADAHEGDLYDRVYNTGWSRCAVNLAEYTGQKVRLSFYHVASLTGSLNGSRAGWYIDEVEVWQGIPDMPVLESFESGWGDWYADHGVWQVGVSTSGPSSAHDGSSVAATNLSGSYPSQTDSRLISPEITLPSVSDDKKVEVRFWQWFNYIDEYGRLQISVLDSGEWTDWSTLDICAPAGSSDWSLKKYDLTVYSGRTIRLAFYHWARQTNSISGSASGWYIDQVQITTRLGGDSDDSGCVNMDDLENLAYYWLEDNCGFCGGADFSYDQKVNLVDFAILASNWLNGCNP